MLVVSNHKSPVPMPVLGAVAWKWVLFLPPATADTVSIWLLIALIAFALASDSAVIWLESC
ncbi:hypothetical protein D3C77_710780 [compost metagenome]